MPVLIKERGEIEPVIVVGDFTDVKQQFDIAAAKGWSFVAMTRVDNDKIIAFHVPNLIHIEELEDEF